MGMFNTDDVKDAARARWPEILSHLAPVLSDAIDANGTHVRCPLPDHVDCNPSFRVDELANGRAICTCGSYDGWALLQKLRGWDFKTAVSEVGSYLGVTRSVNGKPDRDIVSAVAAAKHMPIDSFRKYGAYPAERNGETVARVPVYNEKGDQHSHFDIGLSGRLKKGLFRKGSGSAGLFFPGRLPQPGETWILDEGVKDTAAYDGLGLNACGLNTDKMAAKYARLFNDVHVIVMPDRTRDAEAKAATTAALLYGKAASVRLGTLPLPIDGKEGDDARDVLAKRDGEHLLRQAIEDAEPWHPIPSRKDLPVVGLPVAETRVSDAAATLGALLDATGRYFVRGQSINRLDEHENGLPLLTPLKPTSFPSVFESVARIVRVTRDKQGNIVSKPATFTEAHARIVTGAEQFIGALAPIRLLTCCPVLIERGGRLVEIRNYDRRSGIMAGGWSALDTGLEDAVALIREILKDFRFATPSDLSRAAAAVITPALTFGGLLGGRPPIDLGEADHSQTGKGFRNKVTAATYGHTPKTVAQRKGGVGGLEESFDTTLIRGAAFVSFDNIRGKFDLPSIESFMTEDEYLARMPYAPPVSIDARRVMVMLTSNRADLTDDLGNRCSCVRILKQVDAYQFAAYPEGNILDHVRANRERVLGAVFAIVREWHSQGQPETDTVDHDFREWARKLDWIVQNLLGMAALLDGHRTVQKRMTTPAFNWLRDLAILVVQEGRSNEWIRPYQILDLLEESEVDVPGLTDDENLADQFVRKKVLQASGRQLKKCFGGESLITVDGINVKRRETKDTEYRHCFEYRFARAVAREQKSTKTPEPRYCPSNPATEHSSLFSTESANKISFTDPSGLAGCSGVSGAAERASEQRSDEREEFFI